MDNVKEIVRDPAVTQVARKQPTTVREGSEITEKKGLESSTAPDSAVLQVNEQRRDEAILEENARLLLQELPEIRVDRVEEARRRLQQGYYEKAEILEKTAEKLHEDLTNAARLDIPADELQATNLPHVRQARSRLVQGYYEQLEILDQTADRIVKKDL